MAMPGQEAQWCRLRYPKHQEGDEHQAYRFADNLCHELIAESYGWPCSTVHISQLVTALKANTKIGHLSPNAVKRIFSDLKHVFQWVCRGGPHSAGRRPAGRTGRHTLEFVAPPRSAPVLVCRTGTHHATEWLRHYD